MKKKLFVGCSSSDDIPKEYIDDCRILLEELFALDYDLVFGACSRGLMGLSYNVALNNYRDVIGISPEVYKEDLNDIKCTGILTKTISDRTDKLIELCDVIVFLPGGIGTIYELFTAIECKRNHEFNKPIIIYNSNGFFDKLLDFMEKVYSEKFSKRTDKNNYVVSSSIPEIISYIHNHEMK